MEIIGIEHRDVVAYKRVRPTLSDRLARYSCRQMKEPQVAIVRLRWDLARLRWDLARMKT